MNATALRPRRLESYVCGQWVAGSKEGTPLLDASTGGVIAFIDATGLDFKAALQYGREKSGHALRALSFHERAAMLKALGQKLMEQKEDFYALSAATGATRADSWIDIEGGIGTLLAYASKGRRELPNTRVPSTETSSPFRGTRPSRPAYPEPVAGRSRPHQRFQFPVLGYAGKACADASRRCSGNHQAGQPDRLSDRIDGSPHYRCRDFA